MSKLVPVLVGVVIGLVAGPALRKLPLVGKIPAVG